MHDRAPSWPGTSALYRLGTSGSLADDQLGERFLDRSDPAASEATFRELIDRNDAKAENPEPDHDDLLAEIERLAETLRRPIVLHYFEGLSTDAIAERLGCPRGTILSRRARALRQDRYRGVMKHLWAIKPGEIQDWGDVQVQVNNRYAPPGQRHRVGGSAIAQRQGRLGIVEERSRLEAVEGAIMPEQETSSSQGTSETGRDKALLSFREFLKVKAKETGGGERRHRRSEWLGAIRRLIDQIREWLPQSDPEEVLDIEPYEVSRTERELGTYDAPALKIQLGAAQVDVLPMTREVPFMAIRGASGEPTEFAGRVDITDGFRKYNLYREVREDNELWQVRDDRNKFTYLDSSSLTEILQDLLS